MKAMILAAGFGTRLKPITESIPKPLVEVNGRPVIEHTLLALKKAGVKSVVINLHHLGNMIEDRLGDGSAYGLDIHYSYEPEIKGTAGALLWVRTALDEPFYLINSDILFDIELTVLPKLLDDRNADALMVLYKATRENMNMANIYMDRQGYVKSLFTPYPDTTPYIFTGIQFLKPSVIDYIPKHLATPSTTMHMYPEMLKKNRPIAGHIHSGLWMDIGHTDRLGTARRLFK
jgi:mannose-1-phosphate guanylyltransferase